MADYPSAIKTFTNPTAINRLNNPSHHLQHANANDEITAVETELGTDVAGTMATLKLRLAVALANNGRLKNLFFNAAENNKEFLKMGFHCLDLIKEIYSQYYDSN